MSKEISTPLISVIIPTYNRAHLISRAIESVRRQSFQRWELIIVDDGSTDDTEDAVKPFLSSKIHYLKIKNSGAAEARNRGALLASGAFLTFLDSDDSAHPRWLEEMAGKISSSNTVLISCGIEIFKPDGSSEIQRPNSKNALHQGITCRFNGGSFLIKASLFQAVSGYDRNIKAGQHTELGLRITTYIIQNNLKAACLEAPLISVFDHTGPKIRQDHQAVFEGSKYFLEKHGSNLQKLSRNGYFRFLSAAGVRGVAAGHFSEARTFLFRAWKLYPLSFKASARLLLACFPEMAQRYWKNNIRKST